MAKRYTRKALNKPDEFVSFWQKAYDAARPYGRAILLACAGAVAVLIIGWSVDYFITSRRQGATEAFDRATRVAEADLITDSAPAKPEDKVPRFKTEKDRSEAVVAELEKLEKEHGSSSVARRARLLRAGTLYDLGRFADAQGAYQKFLDGSSDDDPLRPLAREGVGLCLENQGKLDEALAAFKQAEPKSGDFFRDRAQFDQARVLLKKGDKKAAAELYKEILTKAPQTPLREEITQRMGLLGVAVPPAPTPSLPPGISIGGG